jgi:hypothetical protein
MEHPDATARPVVDASGLARALTDPLLGSQLSGRGR